MGSGLSAVQHGLSVVGIKYNLHSLVIVKSADQTLTQSNTTLQDITDMKKRIGANEVWKFEFLPLINAGATPDIKFGFTIPASGDVLIVAMHRDAANASFVTGYTVLQGSGAINVRGIGQDFPNIYFVGIIINAGTAGDFQCQAAQNTSDASDIKVLENSVLIMKRLK